MPYCEILSPRFLRTASQALSVLQNLGLSISWYGSCIRLINSKPWSTFYPLGQIVSGIGPFPQWFSIAICGGFKKSTWEFLPPLGGTYRIFRLDYSEVKVFIINNRTIMSIARDTSLKIIESDWPLWNFTLHYQWQRAIHMGDVIIICEDVPYQWNISSLSMRHTIITCKDGNLVMRTSLIFLRIRY